jgi:hypothetical protein
MTPQRQSDILKIRLVGLACLIAAVLTGEAVASAEPSESSTSDSTDEATPAESPSGAAVRHASSSEDEAEQTKTTRHDERCPWGRLGDGHGKTVRCLTDVEARGLAQAAKRDALNDADASRSRPEDASGIVAVVNSVVFEGESISTAKSNLSGLASDYQSCVAHHGGLRRDAGEVRIRFHVDSRGIARDSSVSRRRFVSVKAARCVSEMVNHRVIGPSKSKTVGTVLIHFSRSGG